MKSNGTSPTVNVATREFVWWMGAADLTSQGVKHGGLTQSTATRDVNFRNTCFTSGTAFQKEQLGTAGMDSGPSKESDE